MRTLILFALFFPLVLQAGSSTLSLKEGVGQEKVLMHCQTCHSLDYIEMNANFLGEKGWTKEVNKMINAFGAKIPSEDVSILVRYLSINY